MGQGWFFCGMEVHLDGVFLCGKEGGALEKLPQSGGKAVEKGVVGAIRLQIVRHGPSAIPTR